MKEVANVTAKFQSKANNILKIGNAYSRHAFTFKKFLMLMVNT